MSTSTAGRMPTVLLVDDDEQLLAAPARVLKQAGYHVITALGGERGLKRIREHRPDLVLLDWDMRDIDGVKVCSRVKSDPALRDIRIVFFSGVFRSAKSQAIAREAGADGYIERPVGNRELLEKVELYLGRPA